MDPDPAPQPPAPLPETRPVPPGILCRRCSYDLGGLPPSGRCPECGKPIAESLRGDLLIYADAAYLAKVLLGVRIALACIPATLVLTIGGLLVGVVASATGFAPSPAAVGSTSTALGFAISAASIYGYFLFSTPDPGVDIRDHGSRPRRVLRITTLIQAALAPTSFIARYIAPAAPAALVAGGLASPAAVLALLFYLTSFVAWAVQFFACMRYVRWLAPRIPDARILRRSQRYQWLLPLLFIPGACILMIGPLVAMVLYYNLFNALRKRLRTIIATVAAQAAVPLGTE